MKPGQWRDHQAKAALGTGGALLSSVLLLAGCGTVPPTAGSSGEPSLAAPTTTSSSAATMPVDGDTCDYTETGQAAKPVNPPRATGVPVSGTIAFVLKMTEGNLTITMNRSKAPCTVNSFESLADQGYFNQTRCHRLTEQGIFVLQCGDPTGTGTGGPGYQFADEVDGTETYGKGAVAMANAGPNTNGSQFFLVWADSTVAAELHGVRSAGRRLARGAGREDRQPRALDRRQLGRRQAHRHGRDRHRDPEVAGRAATSAGDISRASSTGNSR